MTELPVRLVDVFTNEAFLGNPLAVVPQASGVSEAAMAAFANWINLSETTFLLPPTNPRADYRLRIFTPNSELPFAGHPTLGSCQVWLDQGGQPQAEEIIQECGVGLVRIRHSGGRLAFAAPPLIRSGAPDAETLARIVKALRISPDEVIAAQWVSNGPPWVAVLLRSRAAVLALQPDYQSFGDLFIGVAGAWPAGEECAFEVRGFLPSGGINEDPVTGSLNAGLALWLIGAGLAPERYVASQGAALGRKGRVHVEQANGTIWIGGDVVTCVRGGLSLK